MWISKRSSRNERNFLFVCFEANGSLRSSLTEDNWSIIVTKLSQNCVWMANNEGGRASIKLPCPGQRGSGLMIVGGRGVTQGEEKLNTRNWLNLSPLPPPFLNHGTNSWLGNVPGFHFKTKGPRGEEVCQNVNKPVCIFCWNNWEFYGAVNKHVKVNSANFVFCPGWHKWAKLIKPRPCHPTESRFWRLLGSFVLWKPSLMHFDHARGTQWVIAPESWVPITQIGENPDIYWHSPNLATILKIKTRKHIFVFSACCLKQLHVV